MPTDIHNHVDVNAKEIAIKITFINFNRLDSKS